MAYIIKNICNLEDEVLPILIGDRLHLVKKVLLTKYQDSLFVELVEKQENPTAVVYIDRDATHFNSILNFLRGELNLNNWSRKELDELSAEASFYKLTDLTDQIEDQISHRDWTQQILDESKAYIIYRDEKSLINSLKNCNKLTFVFKFVEYKDLKTCEYFDKIRQEFNMYERLFQIRFMINDRLYNDELFVYDFMGTTLRSLNKINGVIKPSELKIKALMEYARLQSGNILQDESTEEEDLD